MNPAFIIESRCFDIRQIALSGQCFRIEQLSLSDSENEIRYSVVSQNRYLELLQETAHSGLSRVSFFCPEKDCAFWSFYFDLDTDYEAYLSSISPDDSYLMAAGQAGRGIRILRQDLWEMIVTFMISQQKTIPAIRQAVENLSRLYGTPLSTMTGEIYYTFPNPEQLSTASVQDLLDLKLGYRAKYISKITQDACSGVLDLNYLSALDYPSSMEYLRQFYGIGEKVANCICLFGLHHIDAFPVDTWIQKILIKEYYPKHPRRYKKLPKNRLYHTIIQDYFSQYKGYAGLMQQYIFFYERMVQTLTTRNPML